MERALDTRKEAPARPSAEPAAETPRAPFGRPTLGPSEVLALQRQAGNQAVVRALDGERADRGLRVTRDDEEPVRGRTPGEAVGDVARPVGTGLGNALGGIMGAVTGISVSSSTDTGPTWSPGAQFEWHVGFATTGRSGWLVQEIGRASCRERV